MTSIRAHASASQLLLSAIAALLTCGALTASPGARAATPQGTFTLQLENDPGTLNPITVSDVYGQEIDGNVFDSLAIRQVLVGLW